MHKSYAGFKGVNSVQETKGDKNSRRAYCTHHLLMFNLKE